MQIEITPLARIDLEELEDYLLELSPSGLKNVVADIKETIWSIPGSVIQGRPTPRDNVFEKLSPKYKYLIPYTIMDDTVYILRIYHPSRCPLKYDEDINLPKK